MADLTLADADALDALGFEIFDPHLDPVTLTYTGPATGLKTPSTDMDAKLYTAISRVMLAIEGRTPEPGFKLTLNFTCALKIRPYYWYIRGLMEYDRASLWPANLEFGYAHPDNPGGIYTGCNSFGYGLGLAACATICHAWAMILRMWLMKNYPYAPNQYTGPLPI